MLELIIKGFIVGIAFIIPGVSGGTLAIYLGIYKKLLNAIASIFSDFKNSMKFLIPFGLGVVLSVLGLAKLIGILIEWNSFIVLLFFIGLLLGGIKHIYIKANVKELNISVIFSFLISFGFLLTIIILDKSKPTQGLEYFKLLPLDYVIILGLGIISSATMIVPGISGSAMLMVLGFYTAIVSNVIGNLFDLSSFAYNLQVVIVFGLGVAIGIIVFSNIISYLLERYSKQVYFSILGFIIASILGVFLEIKDPSTAVSYEHQSPIYKDLWAYLSNHPWTLVIGIVLMIIGFMTSKYLTKYERKEEHYES